MFYPTIKYVANPQFNGMYIPENDTIIIKQGLPDRWKEYVINHELYHASGHTERNNRYTLTHFNDLAINRIHEELFADTLAYIIDTCRYGQDTCITYQWKYYIITQSRSTFDDIKLDYNDLYQALDYFFEGEYNEKVFNNCKQFIEKVIYETRKHK